MKQRTGRGRVIVVVTQGAVVPADTYVFYVYCVYFYRAGYLLSTLFMLILKSLRR